MTKYHLRRPGVCLAAAVAFGSLVSATPGLADSSFNTPGETKDSLSLPAVDPAVASPLPAVVVEEPAGVAEELPEVADEPADEGYELIGEGEASYYGHELAGNRTASGERFNPKALTAAHRTLPLGSKLRVTNKANGKSVIVRINDRGPFVKKRLIDVSLGAAQQINMVRAGKAMVKLELLR